MIVRNKDAAVRNRFGEKAALKRKALRKDRQRLRITQRRRGRGEEVESLKFKVERSRIAAEEPKVGPCREGSVFVILCSMKIDFSPEQEANWLRLRRRKALTPNDW